MTKRNICPTCKGWKSKYAELCMKCWRKAVHAKAYKPSPLDKNEKKEIRDDKKTK